MIRHVESVPDRRKLKVAGCAVLSGAACGIEKLEVLRVFSALPKIHPCVLKIVLSCDVSCPRIYWYTLTMCNKKLHKLNKFANLHIV